MMEAGANALTFQSQLRANHVVVVSAEIQRRIQMDNEQPVEESRFTVLLKLVEGDYDEQLTLRCLPQFGGAAA